MEKQNQQPKPTGIMRISSASELEALSVPELIGSPYLLEKFSHLFNVVHRTNNGITRFEADKFFFNKLLAENPKLKECTRVSVMGCLMEGAIDGLSVNPTDKETYFIPERVSIGEREGQKIYEVRLSRKIQAVGELRLRINAGQIRHAENVVVVYEGDSFEVSENNGVKGVKYSAKIPRQSSKVIACFVKIVRLDGTIDFFYQTEEDFNRLREYSSKRNFGKPNALYSSNNGSIDSGFAATKVLKHAFKHLPKIKTGNFSKVEAADDDQDTNAFDPYKLNPVNDLISEGSATGYTDYSEEPTDQKSSPELSTDAKVAQAAASEQEQPSVKKTSDNPEEELFK